MPRLLLTLLALLALPVTAQETALPYQTPAPELAALVDAPPPPAVALSPDRQAMLLMERPALPGIVELAQPERGLAGLRINPRTNGPSRAVTFSGLAVQPVAEGAEARTIRGLPEGARIRNAAWSPDSRRVAFTLDLDAEVALYVADVASGEARRLSSRALNDAAPGSPFQWNADGALVARVVPADRGPAPEAPSAPSGPIVQESSGEAAPARTFQDLLQDAHDEALFAHYFDAELVHLRADGTETPLGIRGLITSFQPAPDARHLLVEATERPFSYLVPLSRFPRRVAVHALPSGALVAEIAALALAENVPLGTGSVPTGPRSHQWRPDVPATLLWTEAQDDGDIRAAAEVRDRVYALSAPFSGEPRELAATELRFGGVQFTDAGMALLSEWEWQSRRRVTHLLDPETGASRVLFDLSFEDRYNDPGSPVTQPNAAGISVAVTTDGGRTLYLTGAGASPEGNRPFLRALDTETGETRELFRSASPHYEVPVALLDGDRLVTRREAPTEPPNFFLRDLSTGAVAALTAFPHPYPELASVQREAITYTRADGVPLSATLYLPPGYDPERDGPLPTLVWAYPREFRSADAAGQRTDSPYQFTSISYWGAVPYVTRGYAVFDDAAMPIVGEGETEPNDVFVDQLVANAEAILAEGVRRGVLDPDRVAVGGHSYGAFMTANLLAYTRLFRAGIARSGAYNRTLTPFGFQSEERTYWEAPEVYNTMSPFQNAHRITDPILLIHGAADNNSGTFPMQSERLYNAIKGLGGTTRLVMLPHESHGYRARESVLHMLWETDRWLEQHVKQAAPRPTETAAAGG